MASQQRLLGDAIWAHPQWEAGAFSLHPQNNQDITTGTPPVPRGFETIVHGNLRLAQRQLFPFGRIIETGKVGKLRQEVD